MNAEHPLARPADETLQELAQASGSKQLGDLTASTLLGERAALLGLPRPFGGRSCSGASRLLSCDDGCIAVSLPRESDWELLPAWLESEQIDSWLGVRKSVETQSIERLVDRGRLLGLAISDASAPPGATSLRPLNRTNGDARARRPLVVDLSALWAGPLCAQLLWLAGAHVIKVESTTRPDGARLGNQQFYGLLNQGKRSVALNFDDPNQARVLHRLLEGADIVIESSRPRALNQLGVCPDELVNRREGLIWVSITGYGREGTRGQLDCLRGRCGCCRRTLISYEPGNRETMNLPVMPLPTRSLASRPLGGLGTRGSMEEANSSRSL